MGKVIASSFNSKKIPPDHIKLKAFLPEKNQSGQFLPTSCKKD
jgi:hypothetical protein